MIFKKDKLTVRVYDTVYEMSRSVASDVSECIKELLEKKKHINILFAAAPSQTEFLSVLASDDSIQWERINAFHMDEYIGLDSEDKRRFRAFLDEKIFKHRPFNQIHYIETERDPLLECKRYTELLINNPIDIVCLGIGENGHIAFNDPHVADFNDPFIVKIVSLDEMCRQQQVNDKCFLDLSEVPTHALTLTIPALVAAQNLFCIVPYSNKAQAVYRTIMDEISEKCPATVLRKTENSVLYLDSDSSKLLNL